MIMLIEILLLFFYNYSCLKIFTQPTTCLWKQCELLIVSTFASDNNCCIEKNVYFISQLHSVKYFFTFVFFFLIKKKHIFAKYVYNNYYFQETN